MLGLGAFVLSTFEIRVLAVRLAQFSDSLSTDSIIRASIGPLFDSSLSAGCSCKAVNNEGPSRGGTGGVAGIGGATHSPVPGSPRKRDVERRGQTRRIDDHPIHESRPSPDQLGHRNSRERNKPRPMRLHPTGGVAVQSLEDRRSCAQSLIAFSQT